MDLQSAKDLPNFGRRVTLFAVAICFSLSSAILIATLASTRPLAELRPSTPTHNL